MKSFARKKISMRLEIQLKKKIKDLSFAGIIWKAKNTISIDKPTFEKIIHFIDLLEDDEDVQNVYTNFDIDETILQELEA